MPTELLLVNPSRPRKRLRRAKHGYVFTVPVRGLKKVKRKAKAKRLTRKRRIRNAHGQFVKTNPKAR